MKFLLEFHGEKEPSIKLEGETPAERAILAFLAEGSAQQWRIYPSMSYRASGVDKIELYRLPVSPTGRENE